MDPNGYLSRRDNQPGCGLFVAVLLGCSYGPACVRMAEDGLRAHRAAVALAPPVPVRRLLHGQELGLYRMPVST